MLDTNIYEIIIKAVEKSAQASFHWINKKNNDAADLAAVEAMRDWLKQNHFPGKITIGEGERDQAPMLYIGEQFCEGAEILYDIAVDPLEGTNLCAYAKPNAMSVIAVGKKGTILNAPDLYMKKIATNSNIHEDEINLNLPLTSIIKNIAKHNNKATKDINLSILNRDRHLPYIEEAKSLDIKIHLIEDGDILAAIECSDYLQKHDLYFGIGGAPEGVLAAAALKCLGGKFLGQLQINDEAQKIYAHKLNITDFEKIYSIDDLVKDDVIFAASGVTSGELLEGVSINQNSCSVNSILLHFSKGLIRKINSKYPNL